MLSAAKHGRSGSLRRSVLQTPDPEFAAEDENEVEFTDLDSPSKTGKVPRTFASQRKVHLFRTRSRMTIAIIAGIALLAFTVLLNVSHVPKQQEWPYNLYKSIIQS